MSATIDKPEVLIPIGDMFPAVGTVLFKCKSCGRVHWKVVENSHTGYTFLAISQYGKERLEKSRSGEWERHIWCYQCGFHAVEPNISEL